MWSRVCGAVLVLLAAAGCSDGGDPSPEPTAGASMESSPSDPSSDPASTASPAATGQRIETDLVSYRLPEGDWDVGRGGLSQNLLDEQGDLWSIAVLEGPAFGSTTLAMIARSTIGFVASEWPDARRVEDRTIDGQTCYVVESRGRNGRFYEIGRVSGDQVVQLQFEFPEDSPRAEGWIESVLATVEWR